MGGFHLYKAPSSKVEKVINILQKFNIDKIIPYHCSGEEMIKILNERENFRKA